MNGLEYCRLVRQKGYKRGKGHRLHYEVVHEMMGRLKEYTKDG